MGSNHYTIVGYLNLVLEDRKMMVEVGILGFTSFPESKVSHTCFAKNGVVHHESYSS